MFDIQFSDGSGHLTRYPDWQSKWPIQARHVDVWCPPGYNDPINANTRYPVLYMHDGQNLFDAMGAFTGVDWGIDEAINRMVQADPTGTFKGAVVVGLWNTANRWRDYMPVKPLELLKAHQANTEYMKRAGSVVAVSDDYLKFIVQEIKPFIDQTYRTLPDPAHTAIMGSSMGALISLYALTEYPAVFGGAGCVSIHWSAGDNTILVDYFGQAIPKAGQHRLYFDFGTEGLDARYEPYQRRMDDHLRAAGYRQGVDCLTRKFEGADHNEASWRARVEIPLRFLLTSTP
jgi:predicted alpha/beta superfamily hydrolase